MRKYVLTASLTAALMWHLPLPAEDRDCLKQVFHDYCLGGPFTRTDTMREQDGQLRWRKDEHDYSARLEDERLVSLTRRITPGEWITFVRWRRQLESAYGRDEDRSTLPSYATSRTSRSRAVAAGRGAAISAWPQDGWEIVLRWDDPQGIDLVYRVTESANEESGLSTAEELGL